MNVLLLAQLQAACGTIRLAHQDHVSIISMHNGSVCFFPDRLQPATPRAPGRSVSRNRMAQPTVTQLVAGKTGQSKRRL